MPLGSVFDQGVRHRPARLWPQPECTGYSDGDQCWVGDRSQVSEPNTIRVRVDEIGGDSHGQSSLTGAARADDGDKSLLADELAESDLFVYSSYETGRRGRQVVWGGVHGAGAGEAAFEIGSDELKEPFPVVETAEAMKAQIH
jgi:hypothetical protein